MLFVFIMTTVLISTVSLYSFKVSEDFIDQMSNMYDLTTSLKKIETDLDLLQEQLTKYLTTKSSDNLVLYNSYSSELLNDAYELEANLKDYDEYLKLEDIVNMTLTYFEYADNAIAAKRGRKVDEYTSQYKEASKIAGYIKTYIDELSITEINRNTGFYRAISQNMNNIQSANIFMIVVIVLLVLLIIIYSTYTMTEPIRKLSHSANELSKGNFDVEEVHVTSKDEIKVMVEAFNKMKYNIQEYINELHEKAEMEATLMDEKMKNLNMQHLLNNAELQALQSQINPHFLYNTLNAAVQLSMIEGADQTSMFVENIASLFRYNVRKLDTSVTLKEEVKNVKSYYELLKVRFGDLIRFEFDIEESTLSMRMPPLVLQPIVENAYIHGVGDSEEGGKILIRVHREDKSIVISVIDNGKGMNQEDIEHIYSKVNSPEVSVLTKPKKGHTTGIGMSNVIHRLEIFYGINDILSIKSQVGEGTEVSIVLPAHHTSLNN